VTSQPFRFAQNRQPDRGQKIHAKMDPTKLSLAHSGVSHENRPQPCPEPIDIGDGLVMRQATPEDRDELSTFNAVTHFPAGGRMTLNWFNGTHPTIDPSCFTVVVDTTKEAKPIISSVMSVPQVWLYGSPSAVSNGDLGGYVAMPVTRIEAVGTSPEYRSKGKAQDPWFLQNSKLKIFLLSV
jgi:hypothetical protein